MRQDLDTRARHCDDVWRLRGGAGARQKVRVVGRDQQARDENTQHLLGPRRLFTACSGSGT